MNTIKLKNFTAQYRTLLVLATFSIALLCARVVVTHSIFYLFMAWNLVLAFSPLMASAFISRARSGRWFCISLVIWLLLLPNSPYVLTDFIHLRKDNSVPVWFDVLLLVSFSAAALLPGLASMKIVFRELSERTGIFASWFFMGIISLLSGLGIYIGRFLRYNSWDVLRRPVGMLTDIFNVVTGDGTREAIGVTIGFGCFMFLLFNLYYTPEK